MKTPLISPIMLIFVWLMFNEKYDNATHCFRNIQNQGIVSFSIRSQLKVVPNTKQSSTDTRFGIYQINLPILWLEKKPKCINYMQSEKNKTISPWIINDQGLNSILITWRITYRWAATIPCQARTFEFWQRSVAHCPRISLQHKFTSTFKK